MGSRISLRDDFDGGTLRRLAKQSSDANRMRRSLALASIYDGGKRLEAARIGGVTLQIVRDWVLRFNSEGSEGLVDRKPPGAVPKLTPEHRTALARIVEDGPIPAVHGVVRWRIKDLVVWLHEEFGLSVAESTVRGTLKDMGFVKLTARPRHHGQNEDALEAFKKRFPAELKALKARLGLRTPVEIWWQDEARVGQKTKITRQWAHKGTRHVAPKDRRTKSVWIFGAICPAAGLVVLRCNTAMMQLHLDEISAHVAPGAHAVLIMDRAEWHMTGKLQVPDNITILHLPPKAPELNPVENV